MITLLSAVLVEPSFGLIAWILVAVALVLVADVFLNLDVVAPSALLVVSVLFALMIDLPFPWQLLLMVLFWTLSLLLFFAGWRIAARPLNTLFGSQIHESHTQAVGQECEYRFINGKQFAYWNGDLWPAKVMEGAELHDEGRATIVKVEDGRFILIDTVK